LATHKGAAEHELLLNKVASVVNLTMGDTQHCGSAEDPGFAPHPKGGGKSVPAHSVTFHNFLREFSHISPDKCTDKCALRITVNWKG